ncbi:hypothetical protein CRG98_016279 [Punica granatum]|uniref:Uncharacterized protein n=1 Tax=Punica granatum TaxID=22663 RepID=A0A2I0K402_PUNGR|nr:hypothetical protein CRG98_016279 [Punica granatum]
MGAVLAWSDCSGSPVIWHNRCALLTFLTLESDGNWKILAVPVQCPDNTNPLTRHSRKVQRKVGSQRDSSKVNHNYVETNEAPRDEYKKHRPAKDSGKGKRKHCPNSKQESNRYTRKGSSIDKSELRSSNKSAHSNISSVSEVASPSGSRRDQLRTGEAECLNPEAVEDSCVCHDGLQLNGDNANGVDQSGKEDVLSESCGQKSTAGSVTRKWVPVGTKALAATGLTDEEEFIGDPDNLKTYENSTVGNLPIFPLLVPRASKDDIASQTVESAESHESELIFEYFELEPPQQRQPLYEKYSVAWYPIYRIPDGDFRAAFLTYHSLGHFVRRDGLDNCVASPVVGLQSYNAQASPDEPKVTNPEFRPIEDPNRATQDPGGGGFLDV